MRLLLDTQCWLWMIEIPERLSRSTRGLFESSEHELYLSAASSWGSRDTDAAGNSIARLVPISRLNSLAVFRGSRSMNRRARTPVLTRPRASMRTTEGGRSGGQEHVRLALHAGPQVQEPARHGRQADRAINDRLRRAPRPVQ